MSLANHGARAGAAAFVLGMSLAGPQALGVATADNTDAGDSSAAAGTAPGATAKSSGTGKARPGPSRTNVLPGASAPHGAAVDEMDIIAGDISSAAGSDGPEEISASVRQSMPSPGLRLKAQTVDLGPSQELEPSRLTVEQPTIPAAASATFVEPISGVGEMVSSAPVVPGSRAIVRTELPTAAPVPTTFLGAVDAVVTKLFDVTEDFVAWLPSSQLSTWLEGALSQLRRKWFNHAPTASVVQYMKGPDSVVGKIVAADLEDEAIIYTVLTNPSKGTVTVDDKGTFHYDATTRFEGTHSFVVSVDNPDRGSNILAVDDGPTLLTVTVSGTFRPVLQAPQTEGFVIYNLSSRRLQYQGAWDQADNDENPFELAPAKNLILEPGDSVRVEIKWGGGITDASLFFTSLDDPFGNQGEAWYGMWLQNQHNKPDVEMTESSEVTGDIDWDTDVENDVTAIRLMDAPGQIIDATNGTPEDVENALRIFRAIDAKNLADVAYTPAGKPIGSVFNSKDFRKVWVNSVEPLWQIPNDDPDNGFTFSETVGFDASESASTSVTSALSADILMMVSASVEANYSSTVEKTHHYEKTVTKVVGANSVLQLFVSHRVLRVTGDLKVQYGNTTLLLGNVDYDTPDSSVEAVITYKVIPLKDWVDPSKA